MSNAFVQQFQTQRKALEEAFFASDDVDSYLRSHSQAADSLIRSLACLLYTSPSPRDA